MFIRGYRRRLTNVKNEKWKFRNRVEMNDQSISYSIYFI